MLLQRLLKAALVAVALLSPVAHGAQRHDVTHNQLTYENNNGYIGITTPSNETVHVKLERISEHDTNGHKVDFVPQFENHVYNWTDPVTTECAGVPCIVSSTSTVLTTQHGDPVQFDMTTSIVFDDAEVPYADETVLVPRDSVKFAFNISGWNFKNMNNTLQLGASISGHSYNKRYQANNTVIADTVGFLDMPNVAIVDSAVGLVDTDFDYNNASKASIHWTLPAFEHYLYYDPVIGFITSASVRNYVVAPLEILAFALITNMLA